MIVGGIGTIEKRGPNTWRIRLAIGKDPRTGKYRQKSRTVHGSKADAYREREAMRRELEQGLRIDADKLTFMEFAAEFLRRREIKGSYKDVTLSGDRMHIRRLETYLGDLRLRQIDAATLMFMQNQMHQDGYTNTMMHSTIGKLRQMLREAVRLDLIPTNPCDKIDIPQADTHQMTILDAAGAQRLIETLDRHERFITKNPSNSPAHICLEKSRIIGARLALSTGMRRGEILGLTWSCTDLDHRSLHIKQQVTANGSIRNPKTKSGIRNISIDAPLAAHLKQWKRDQRDLLHRLDAPVSSDTPVVSNSAGSFADASDFSMWWSRFRDAHGFQGLRFHDLRHTQATLLIGNGVDIKTVQSRLGHSRAATTLDTYACALPENDRKAADLFGSILDKSLQKSVF